jgi:uncharacterized membrane protein YtjA (UPF0391 family)
LQPGSELSKAELRRRAVSATAHWNRSDDQKLHEGFFRSAATHKREGERTVTLLKWALIFLVVSVIAGILGFTGISAASADVARFLFYVFVVIFLVLLVLGLTIFRV